MAKEEITRDVGPSWSNYKGGSSIKNGDLEIAVIERKDGKWFMALAYGSEEYPERMSTLYHLFSMNCEDAKKEAIQIAASLSISFGSDIESLIGKISGTDCSSSMPPGSMMLCPVCGKSSEPRMRDPVSSVMWYVCRCGQKWKTSLRKSEPPKPEKKRTKFEKFEVSEGPHLDPREPSLGWKEMSDRLRKIENSMESRMSSISNKLDMKLKISEINNMDFFPKLKITSEDGVVIGDMFISESKEGLWVTARINGLPS